MYARYMHAHHLIKYSLVQVVALNTTAPAIHVPPDFNISTVLRSFPKATACGPSGLRVQHLIDALDATLPTSIDSLLRQVINLLITGKVPAALALTALMKLEELGWDVRLSQTSGSN